ncbi:hypothetical protein EYF80_015634 [Liparis tanakae]|uniref:Uncharacterized protein n=1 Tax=Liparis tanakae TaxID=230148 RepID=A0A4Z2I7Z8_9TELE|nr:hypothetical protein EYF80_015634 [Liparis tanakae]
MFAVDHKPALMDVLRCCHKERTQRRRRGVKPDRLTSVHVTYFESSEEGWKAESEQNSMSSRRRKRAGCSSTDQPHHHGVVAHVSSRVQAGHAVVGPQVDVGAAVVHQVLCNVQVPLLAGQVERGGAGQVSVGRGVVSRHSPAVRLHLRPPSDGEQPPDDLRTAEPGGEVQGSGAGGIPVLETRTHCKGFRGEMLPVDKLTSTLQPPKSTSHCSSRTWPVAAASCAGVALFEARASATSPSSLTRSCRHSRRPHLAAWCTGPAPCASAMTGER